jgi:hypothetical protein
MRTSSVICAGLALAGCNVTEGRPVGDGTITGFVSEITKPGSIQEARNRADDNKCREYGFKPGTDPYGNCRVQMEQIRATRALER